MISYQDADDAYKAGEQAARDSVPLVRNPYTGQGLILPRQWRNGWLRVTRLLEETNP